MKVEILFILIFNVRRRIHMIILLQSVTIQFRKLFLCISYYKVRQVLQSVTDFIIKCVRYYKVWQLLHVRRKNGHLHICPIFSILKIVLNMAFEENNESSCSSIYLWRIEIFHWDGHTEYFLKWSCYIIFILTVVFV